MNTKTIIICQICDILGIQPKDLDLNKSLGSLGLDSLDIMLLELRLELKFPYTFTGSLRSKDTVETITKRLS
jgi:acyl carrier protein